MSNGYSADLKGWVNTQLHQPGFRLYLDEIRRRKDSLESAALAKGNTDWEKAQVAMLVWVLDLHKHIATDDTTDTSV